MAENCARPGCGHDAHWHSPTFGCYAVPIHCPAYRTPEQQEAWEALAKVNQQHRLPPWTVIERLLEVNP